MPPIRHAGVLLAAAFLAAFSASGERHYVDHLRSETRSAMSGPTLRLPVRPVSRMAPAGGGKPAKVATATAPPPRPSSFPRLVRELTPRARPHGADALGTGSLGKSQIWLVRGGHGRLGPG